MGLAGVRADAPFVLAFEDVPAATPLLPLVRAERAELAAVLGAEVRFGTAADPWEQRWVARVDPAAPVARLEWDGRTRELTSVLPTPGEFGVGLHLLHSLAHAADDVVEHRPCRTSAEAFDRIRDEVANVYPSFALRGLDWEAITARHAHVRDLTGEAFERGAQAWVAELGDAHTHLFRSDVARWHPPYLARMADNGARLLHVPADTAAARAGVGPGWVVDVEDPADWLRRTGASPQHRDMIAARRFLAMAAPARRFTARGPGGRTVAWTEERAARAALERTPDGFRLHTFTRAVVAEIDAVLAELRGRPRVTIDLRGNVGGDVLAAMELRTRFLRGRTHLGAVRFSDGRGGLAGPVALHADPHPEPWAGEVRILIDAMTYSASEDFVLGLQGLDHVRVEGEPSGGGSGRPHVRRVTDTLDLSVSTALTFDRTGRCIEYHGLPVDGPASG
ncbi:S41 family peptidase [Georgenia faecalis]|uniref:S41 family peptidase n=1 Tax=Georgenia faecalis TaxID=2483799 RepID=A0ABV9D567_9MICO|nr:S41 family peptidase [Georgenia faecalis]